MKKTISILIMGAHISQMALAGNLRKLHTAFASNKHFVQSASGHTLPASTSLTNAFESKIKTISEIPHLKSLVNPRNSEKSAAFAEPILASKSHFYAHHLITDSNGGKTKLIKFEIPETQDLPYKTSVKTYDIQLFSSPAELKEFSLSPEVFSVNRQWSKNSKHSTQDYYFPATFTEGRAKQDYRVKLYSQEHDETSILNVMNSADNNFQSLRFNLGSQGRNFKDNVPFEFQLPAEDRAKNLRIVDFTVDQKNEILTVTTHNGKVQAYKMTDFKTNPLKTTFKKLGPSRNLDSKMEQSLFAEIRVEHGKPVNTKTSDSVSGLEVGKSNLHLNPGEENLPVYEFNKYGNSNR